MKMMSGLLRAEAAVQNLFRKCTGRIDAATPLWPVLSDSVVDGGNVGDLVEVKGVDADSSHLYNVQASFMDMFCAAIVKSLGLFIGARPDVCQRIHVSERSSVMIGRSS